MPSPPQPKNWWDHGIVIFLLILFCFPVGLGLVWFSKRPVYQKVLWTLLFVLFIVFGKFAEEMEKRSESQATHAQDPRLSEQQKRIDHAHQLWESDQRFEAVREYKDLLRSHDVAWGEFGDEIAVLFRRVIDHEAAYGDPGTARDWCLIAYQKSNQEGFLILRQLSFSSEEAQAIWEEVTRADPYGY